MQTLAAPIIKFQTKKKSTNFFTIKPKKKKNSFYFVQMEWKKNDILHVSNRMKNISFNYQDWFDYEYFVDVMVFVFFV